MQLSSWKLIYQWWILQPATFDYTGTQHREPVQYCSMKFNAHLRHLKFAENRSDVPISRAEILRCAPGGCCFSDSWVQSRCSPDALILARSSGLSPGGEGGERYGRYLGNMGMGGMGLFLFPEALCSPDWATRPQQRTQKWLITSNSGREEVNKKK